MRRTKLNRITKIIELRKSISYIEFAKLCDFEKELESRSIQKIGNIFVRVNPARTIKKNISLDHFSTLVLDDASSKLSGNSKMVMHEFKNKTGVVNQVRKFWINNDLNFHNFKAKESSIVINNLKVAKNKNSFLSNDKKIKLNIVKKRNLNTNNLSPLDIKSKTLANHFDNKAVKLIGNISFKVNPANSIESKLTLPQLDLTSTEKEKFDE